MWEDGLGGNKTIYRYVIIILKGRSYQLFWVDALVADLVMCISKIILKKFAQNEYNCLNE